MGAGATPRSRPPPAALTPCLAPGLARHSPASPPPSFPLPPLMPQATCRTWTSWRTATPPRPLQRAPPARRPFSPPAPTRASWPPTPSWACTKRRAAAAATPSCCSPSCRCGGMCAEGSGLEAATAGHACGCRCRRRASPPAFLLPPSPPSSVPLGPILLCALRRRQAAGVRRARQWRQRAALLRGGRGRRGERLKRHARGRHRRRGPRAGAFELLYLSSACWLPAVCCHLLVQAPLLLEPAHTRSP